MAEPIYTWHKVAESVNELAFNNNNLLTIMVDKKRITMARVKDRLLACGYTCPHAGGILADGRIDAMGNIICPLHQYRFNMCNGRNTSGEGYFLKTFPVQQREDGVYIGMEDKKLFGLF